LVNVIIPAYRAAQTLAATLDSVLAPTFTDYEIIVVNDGSPHSEDLEKTLEPYHDRVIYLRQEMLGAGLFDPAFRRAKDVDLWLRIAMRGRRIAYQRRVLGCYRRRAGSLSSDRVSMLEGFLAALAKAARDPYFTTTQREVLERQLVVERASLELQKGKDAFLADDVEAAVSHLTGANAQHKSLKLASVLTLLQAAPCFLRALYSWRDRHASNLKTQS